MPSRPRRPPRKRLVTPSLVAAAALASPTGAGARDASLKGARYLDPRRPVAERVTDLLRRMTLEEKLAQLQGYWLPKEGVLVDAEGRFTPDAEATRKLLAHGLGQIARPSEHENRKRNLGPRAMAELTNQLQRWVRERTRLGIPLMFHEEGLHGLQAPGATSLPQPIALAATFDPELVERCFTMVAREMRARGAHHALAPVVDVARDPRWGRTEETFGEDPFLVTRMGVAAVLGFQGRRAHANDAIAADRVAATAKHFTAHSQPEAGNNVAPGNHAPTVLREVFLPPFEALVKEAHVAAVMPSYNEIDGVPAHAHTELLREVLRQEWGFDGLVVSDYQGIEQLVDVHHVVPDYPAAAEVALRAGVDLELPNPKTYPSLRTAIEERRVPLTLLDAAVARVLRLKFALGLFEAGDVDPEQAERISGAEAHRPLALEAARKAIVLLKNEGELLPLDRTRVRTLAVIGPNADACRLGGYSGVPRVCVSLLDGLRAAAGDHMRVVHAKGCGLTKSNDWWQDAVETPTADEDARDIKAAVAVAREADVVVLALGDNEQTSREAWAPNHLGDRAHIELFGRQNALAAAILAVGKPVVVVLQNGRPPAIPELAAQAPALIEAFYLGQEGGRALADVLFGEVNPGGKLPITFPRSAGHLPDFYNHKPSARRGYLGEDVSPVFPFGHGLSYTTFSYGKLTVEPASVRAGAQLTATVEVRNTGRRTGDEVVQLYLRDEVSSVTRPVKELVAFERVTLAAGESRAVSLGVRPAALSFWSRGKRIIEPGRFRLMAGGSSHTSTETVFEVTGTRPLTLR